MDRNETLLDYIRTNQRIYTREALDKRLRDEGYTDEEIQAAWQQVLSEGAPATQQPPAPQQTSWVTGTCISIMAILLILIGIALLGLTNLVLGSSSYSDRGPNLALWFVNLGTLVVIAAVIAGSVWLSRRRGWGVERVAGLIFLVALVWYLIVVGTCVNGPSFVL